MLYVIIMSFKTMETRTCPIINNISGGQLLESYYISDVIMWSGPLRELTQLHLCCVIQSQVMGLDLGL